MVFKVIWSEFSEVQLDKIYDYYNEKVNSNFASELILGIIEEPNKLLKMPYLGQEEEFLQGRKEKYHYLVFKNHSFF
jgi:toxin ParE1/3/4